MTTRESATATLPRPTRLAQAVATQRGQMPPRNVLIIADLETENPRVRALLAPESSPCGTHVLRAASGNAAFALLASTSFDTVLADPTLLSGSAAGLATVELLRHKRSQGLDLVWVRG